MSTRPITDEYFCRLLLAIDLMHRRIWDEGFIDINLLNETGADLIRFPTEAIDLLDGVIHANHFSDPYILPRAVAARAYLTDRLNHQSTPLIPYVERTAGITLKPTDPQLREAVMKELALLGQDVTGEPVEDAAAVERLDDWIVKNSPTLQDAELEGFFHALHAQTMPMLERVWGITQPIDLNVQIVDQPQSTWIAWFSGDGRKALMQINRPILDKFPFARTQANMKAFYWHECAGHGAQSSLWRSAIDSKTMPRHCGLTFVQGPESFLNEGIAQMAPLLMAQATGDRATELAYLITSATKLHVNDALCAYLETSGDEEQKLAAAETLMEARAPKPFRPIRDVITRGLKSSTARAYSLPVYGPSFGFFKQAETDLPAERFLAFFKDCLERWSTPAMLQERIQHYKSGAPTDSPDIRPESFG